MRIQRSAGDHGGEAGAVIPTALRGLLEEQGEGATRRSSRVAEAEVRPEIAQLQKTLSGAISSMPQSVFGQKTWGSLNCVRARVDWES